MYDRIQILTSNTDVYNTFVSKFRVYEDEASRLKVGSCPNNDKSIFFLCVSFKLFYFLNLFLPRKPQDFAENSPLFICLFP